MRDVYVLGVAQTVFGKFPDKTAIQLGAAALPHFRR